MQVRMQDMTVKEKPVSDKDDSEELEAQYDDIFTKMQINRQKFKQLNGV